MDSYIDYECAGSASVGKVNFSGAGLCYYRSGINATAGFGTKKPINIEKKSYSRLVVTDSEKGILACIRTGEANGDMTTVNTATIRSRQAANSPDLPIPIEGDYLFFGNTYSYSTYDSGAGGNSISPIQFDNSCRITEIYLE